MNNIPQSLRHVRLLLAREAGHPGGDEAHGYDLVLPLDSEGRIDKDEYKLHRGLCRVRRFRPGEADAVGKLVRGPGGRWTFDYDQAGSGDDENGYRFGDERFVQGEYMSVREDDGDMHTFVVTQVNTI